MLLLDEKKKVQRSREESVSQLHAHPNRKQERKKDLEPGSVIQRSCLQGSKPSKNIKFSIKPRKKQIWHLFSGLRLVRMSKVTHSYQDLVTSIVCDICNPYQLLTCLS